MCQKPSSYSIRCQLFAIDYWLCSCCQYDANAMCTTWAHLWPFTWHPSSTPCCTFSTLVALLPRATSSSWATTPNRDSSQSGQCVCSWPARSGTRKSSPGQPCVGQNWLRVFISQRIATAPKYGRPSRHASIGCQWLQSWPRRSSAVIAGLVNILKQQIGSMEKLTDIPEQWLLLQGSGLARSGQGRKRHPFFWGGGSFLRVTWFLTHFTGHCGLRQEPLRRIRRRGGGTMMAADETLKVLI